ncbi:MAG: T9SS type A sorting domain-containing protein [Prevotellaceae bacterium]|nr:T9SS type A sorting domain-containing protein [Prevotellaceae bacterium]
MSSILVAILFFSLHGQQSHHEASFTSADSIPPKTEVDANKAGLKLYPNPVESELRVVSEKHGIDRLAIYSSVSGELVFSCSIPAPQGASIIINMSAYPSGSYVVRVWFRDVKKPVSCNVYKT